MRTVEIGTWNSAAISARTRKGCWHEAQSVISPSSTCATTVCVSIAYWYTAGNVYSPSTTKSACAKTASISPRSMR